MHDHINLAARTTLARLHARGDENDPFVLAQIEDMKADIHKARDIGESRSAVNHIITWVIF